MSIDATAQALAAGEVAAAETIEQPAEATEDAELAAVWDRANAEPEPEDVPDEAVDEPEAGSSDKAQDDNVEAEADDGTADAEPEPVDVPTDLPKAVRDVWATIPDAARDAIVSSQRKMSRQLAEQGRLVQGLAPIRDVLTQAVQELPALSQMRPEDVASEVMSLAKISSDFQTRPVETMAMLMRQHGIEDAMRQYLGGQQPQQSAMENNQLRQHITRLERQLQQISDPNYLRSQMEQFTSETQVFSEVDQFARDAEHWGDVEPYMPDAIAFVRNAQPDASSSDVLKRAYDLAVSQILPEADKARKPAAAEIAATDADPKRTEAAKNAKSVNVRSKTAAKPRALTEEEELARVYDRMQS